MRRERWVLLAIALAWVAFLLALPAVRDQHRLFDLRVYDGAVRSWAHGHGLYDFGLGERQLGFTYPPFAALLMLWMVVLPYGLVAVVQQAAIVGSVLALTELVVRRLPWFAAWGPWRAAALLTPAMFLLQPLRDTLSFGQVNTEVLLLVLVDLVLLSRGHRFAGIGVGLATAVKLTPGLFIVFVLVAGRRRAAITAAATALGAALLGLLVDPRTSWTYWTEVLPDSTSVGSVDSATNQSVSGLLARLTDSHPGQAPGALLVCAAVGAVVLWTARRLALRGDLLAGFLVVGLGTCAVSPISWIHHLCWVAPALLALADRAVRDRSWRILIGVAVVAGVFMSDLPDRFRAATGEHLSSVGTVVGENAYVVCLLVLIGLLARSRPRVLATS